MPRTIVGLLVGAALGVAGAVMQAITRNPLADPGLLGVNAGASFAVVLAIYGVRRRRRARSRVVRVRSAPPSRRSSCTPSARWARGGATPVRLALAGAALSPLLFALDHAAVPLLDQATLDQFRFWAVGSLAGRDWPRWSRAWSAVHRRRAGRWPPRSLRPLNALGLGDDAAARARHKVGLHPRRRRARDRAAVRGGDGRRRPDRVRRPRRPARRPRHRRARPPLADARTPRCSAPVLLLACDIVGRVIARPGEVQVGIMTAAIGGPRSSCSSAARRMAQL